MRYIDLNDDASRQIIVDKEEGQYLGHVTTVLLEDNKTMIAVYPKGHGRGGIIQKMSFDAGLTWSERMPLPDSFETSMEVPTIYRTYDENGNLLVQLQVNEKEETYLRMEAKYNEDNYVIEERTYSAEDVLDGYVEISYAKDNTEKTLTYYDGEGKATGEVAVKTFDDRGNEIQEVISKDGEVIQTTVNTYIMMEVPVKD